MERTLLARAAIGLLVLVLVAAVAPVRAQDDPQDGEFMIEDASSVDEAVEQITSALEANGFTVMLTLDHAANAESVGAELPPMQLIIFGNPNVGTQLMQASQTTAIDLPQKYLVWEADDGTIQLAYNDPAYLAARHEIEDQEDLLDNISTALAQFGGESVGFGGLDESAVGSGLVIMDSAYDVAETVEQLQTALEDRGFVVPQVVDHSANAANVDLELRPTQVIIFGNPEVGTPLMQAEPQMGLDLPQKFVVWEDAGGAVHVAYNDPVFIGRRHGVDEDQNERLANISAALSGIVAPVEAASE